MPKNEQTKLKYRLISNLGSNEQVIGEYPKLGDIVKILNACYKTIKNIKNNKSKTYSYMKIEKIN